MMPRVSIKSINEEILFEDIFLKQNYEIVCLQPNEEDQQRAVGYAQPMENPRRGT